MPDENSIKPLLERMCALQEQQLEKLSEASAAYSRLAEKDDRLQELWQRQLLAHEQSQKAYEERAARQEKAVRLRAALTLVMLGLIAAAIFFTRAL